MWLNYYWIEIIPFKCCLKRSSKYISCPLSCLSSSRLPYIFYLLVMRDILHLSHNITLRREYARVEKYVCICLICFFCSYNCLKYVFCNSLLSYFLSKQINKSSRSVHSYSAASYYLLYMIIFFIFFLQVYRQVI